MPENTNVDDDGDDRLRATFQEASYPPTPCLKPVVRRRLRRRRMAILGGVVVAAMVAVVWAVDGRQPRLLHEQVAAAPSPQSTIDRTNEMADWPVLFASPPVDSLDLLTHQQATFVMALQQMEKE